MTEVAAPEAQEKSGSQDDKSAKMGLAKMESAKMETARKESA